MKLSKQERIAVIVLIILVILVAGVFLFIKPNIETIIETKGTLANKEKEYNDAVAKAGTKEELKDSILKAYDKGKNTADMFFPELSAYEADNELRALLETCEANILVEDLQVSAPSTSSLSTDVFVPTEVQYALKDYVNQGNTADITDPGLIRQAMIQLKLGVPQTIGATTVTFTLKATTIEDILKFADEVNHYEKDSMRKAVELSTINFIDHKSTDEYHALSEELLAEAKRNAAKIFKEKTGEDLDGVDEIENTPETPTTPNTPDAPNKDDKEKTPLNHYYYEMPCTITFYSIERMQDPSDTLKEQDNMVVAGEPTT